MSHSSCLFTIIGGPGSYNWPGNGLLAALQSLLTEITRWIRIKGGKSIRKAFPIRFRIVYGPAIYWLSFWLGRFMF
jgi:hypothetical protein